MEAVALGFTGKLTSPRSATSKEVAKRLDYPRVSFGEYLREYVAKRGLPLSREVLQEVGDDLVKKDAERLCDKVLSRANWKRGQPLVIDSIRHDDVLPVLESRVSPIPFGLICLNMEWSDQEKRWKDMEVTEKEDLPFFSNLIALQFHDAEIDVINSLIQKADFVIDGNRSVEELTDDIVKFFESWNPERDETWFARNERRILLIKAQNRGGLNRDETDELARLQEDFFNHLRKKHPAPSLTDRLESLESKLRASGELE